MIGNSISFGVADAVTIISSDVTLADAAATSICNSIKKGNITEINTFLNRFRFIKKISCIIIIKENYIGIKGKMPDIIKIDSFSNL